MQKLIQQAQLAAQASSFAEGEGGEEDEYDSERFKHDAFQLIDYVSALLMRLIHQTAVGEYWLTNVMAVLVARVAKIKALLTDIKLGANESIAVGTEHLKDAQTSARGSHSFSINIDVDEEECEEALRIIDADTKEGLTSEEDAKISAYCVTQNKFRSGLNSAIKYILSSLLFTNRSGLPVTNYETMLFQDRDLEYSASSDRNVLNTAQSALSIVNQTLRNTKDRVKQHPPQRDGSVPTYFQWAFLEMTDKKAAIGAGGVSYSRLSDLMEEVQIFSMADIAEVMVALFVTSPILISDFTNFRSMIALSGGVEDVVTSYEEGQFGAFLRLYTREFEQGAKQRETLLLSTAFSQQRFSRCKLLTDGNGRWGRANRQLQRASTLPQIQPTSQHNGEELVQEKLDYCVIQMEKWVVDETSVTVSCKTYVWSLMAITAVLVGGGLAMGLAVGQRIDGVDPFNLATYTWALAAFIIVVFKSMWVESWTWSDFLRQRVRCRSVSELAAATNLDYQLIMAKLLHDDCNGSILVTRGPYNTIFRNQSSDGGDGFSIDQPLSAETLMLSGIALLKVLTPRGHAVVCLDYRCGTLLTILEHRRGTDNSRLVCEDLSRIRRGRDPVDQKAQELISLRLKKVENFKWKRVQGLWEFQNAGIVFE
ncbi:uncharacterized protein Triagg1_7551 [Trichoderma aggressivum f. europaeum]|uniref:Uncharacterized protein n=1 Tax=Trichoderma aggressivum f. europaeum TaxID=173218 RepID=A0AAE1I9Q4_9HYPO|nr:hypothetical protein Triagg1_7551 [Trichoderma aggressivum f. europaeum]